MLDFKHAERRCAGRNCKVHLGIGKRLECFGRADDELHRRFDQQVLNQERWLRQIERKEVTDRDDERNVNLPGFDTISLIEVIGR